jgi:hypothetical protein
MVLALTINKVLVLNIETLDFEENKIEHAITDMKVVHDFIIAKQVGVKSDPLCLLACVKKSLEIFDKGNLENCDVLLQS